MPAHAQPTRRLAAARANPQPARRRSAKRRPPKLVTVILADDHAGIRRSLRLLLDQEEGFVVVAELPEIASVESEVQRHRPQVLVLDLQMRGGSSVETIRRLRQLTPATEIVVLTMQISPAFAQLALDTGALGFVLTDHADSELPTAIREAATGREYVSPGVVAGLAAQRHRR